MASKGTIIVTGANGGLGSAIVSNIIATPELADQYHGIYTVRNTATATSLAGALKAAPASHKHETVALDLSRLASAREVATSINRRVAAGELAPIRALVLCAGYQEHATQDFSPDGLDMSFQCNYLDHWLLTLMLLQSMDKQEGRIVILGSWTHDPYDSRNDAMSIYKEEQWKTIFHNTESLARGTWSATKDYPGMDGGFRRYGAGKLCEVMMMHELQKRLDKDPALSNISVLGVDPGGMPTGISRRSSLAVKILMKVIPLLAVIMNWFQPNGLLRTTSKSAGDVVRAAFDTQSLGEHPKTLYLNGTDPMETSAESRDPVKGETLWRDSIGLAQLKEGETVLVNWR